jgi:hypothetical protein
MGVLKSSRRLIPAERARHDLAGGLIAEATYAEKVLGYGPIAYWPLWETAGVTAVCQVNAAQNGTYGGTITLANSTMPWGDPCPLFQGVNDRVNTFSAALAAAFGAGADDEGSVMVWARAFNVGVWTDGSWRYLLTLYTDLNNRIHLVRWQAVGGRMTMYHRVGGFLSAIDANGLANIAWMHWVLTWSKAANECKLYLDGNQVGLTLTRPNFWVGALTDARIGCEWTSQDTWNGWIGHCAIFPTVLTQPQVADLYAY